MDFKFTDSGLLIASAAMDTLQSQLGPVASELVATSSSYGHEVQCLVWKTGQ